MFSFIIPSDTNQSDVAPELAGLPESPSAFSLLDICPDFEPAGVPDVHMNLYSLRCAFTIRATAPGFQLTFSL